jgi:hypothetical protein
MFTDVVAELLTQYALATALFMTSKLYYTVVHWLTSSYFVLLHC